MILHGNHPISKLIIHSEHLRLLHTGPLLIAASLNQHFHIIGGRRAVQSITCSCVTCRCKSLCPEPPMIGQLPLERVTPDTVFDQVRVDCAVAILIKRGYTRKPVVLKAYIYVFVSLTVKAMHLELVSDLTAEAFIAYLRRFIARRGKPSLIWSDHGSNFVGAAPQIKELFDFLQKDASADSEHTSNFCTSHGIMWNISFQRERLILEDFGRPWSRASRSICTVLWATSSLHLKSYLPC